VGGTIRVFGTTKTVADCLSSQQDRAKPCHWSLAAIQSAQVPKCFANRYSPSWSDDRTLIR
jgi:hypothetical protein